MLVNIENYRGIKQAEFEVKHITLIGGDNGAGKTSIAQAMSSALSGECPVPNLKKQDYKHLVHIGTASSKTKITRTDDGSHTDTTSISFPEGKAFSQGARPPRSSIYATGILSPVDMSKKDASDFWVKILKAEPTLDELRVALADCPRPDDIVGMVRMKGWDGALAQVKEEGAMHKGRWSRITNQNYGTKVGENWQPENLVFVEDVKQLENAVTEAQKQYEESIKKTAIDENRHKELQEIAKDFDTLKQAFEKASKELETAQANYDKSRATFNEMQTADKVHLCPHCQKPVKIKSNTLIKDDGKLAYTDTIKADFEKANNELLTAQQNHRKCEQALNNAIAAQEELSKSVVAVAENDNSALERLSKTKAELKAFIDYTEAQAEHREVMWRISVCNILDPSGLRKQKTDDALQTFNKLLSEISDVAKWGPVAIDYDYNLTYASRPYNILSESEQYRTRASVQVAVALMDKSDVLIFDRADLLTKKGRNGLSRICKNYSFYTLILMSANEPSDIPALDTETEVSYWCQDGAITRIASNE